MTFPDNYPLLKGNLFYKYRGNLGPNQRNLDFVTKQEAYFANTDSFNDPFDCAPSAGVSSVDQLTRMVESICRDPKVPVEVREGHQRVLAEDPEGFLNFVQSGEMTDRYYKEFVDQYSILCLSADPLNRLLWSHYGGNHYGFAIELEIPPNIGLPPQEDWCPEEDGFFPLKVRYSETRPKLGMAGGFDIDLFLKKDECWEYEKEFRIINRGKPRPIKFHSRCLRSVILGARASEETEGTVREAVEAFNTEHSAKAVVHRTQLSRTDYLLSIPGHPFFDQPTESTGDCD